jgi:hypothetical protein
MTQGIAATAFAAVLLSLPLFANRAAPAHADELPLKVQLGAQGSTSQLYILSIADHIVIRSLKVNRGKCSYFTDRQFYLPIALKFGQQLVVLLRSSCHVLEAEIGTDQGSETYSFDPGALLLPRLWRFVLHGHEPVVVVLPRRRSGRFEALRGTGNIL